jgi:hypothetical protein
LFLFIVGLVRYGLYCSGRLTSSAFPLRAYQRNGHYAFSGARERNDRREDATELQPSRVRARRAILSPGCYRGRRLFVATRLKIIWNHSIIKYIPVDPPCGESLSGNAGLWSRSTSNPLSPRKLTGLLELIRSGAHLLQERFKAIVATKRNGWEYEREWRVFAVPQDREPGKDLHYRSVAPHFMLREAMLGARCPAAPAEFASAVKAGGARIEAFNARPAFQSIRIVRQKQLLVSRLPGRSCLRDMQRNLLDEPPKPAGGDSR